MGAPRHGPDPLVSVVVPVLNEEECVEALATRVREALAKAGTRYELIFVDDASRDRTAELIAALRAADPAVKTIRFTRSFGHQAALVAGLLHARGDAVVTMDGDLQHPPEVLPEMIAQWRDGAQVVHAVRAEAAGSGWRDRARGLSYRMIRLLTGVPLVTAGADFRLLDRRAVDSVSALEEHFVFLRGLVPWLGFRDARVSYEREPRFAGESKYGIWPLIKLALNGIFSFSVLPLRVISLVGLATTLVGVLYGFFALASFLFGELSGPPGWTSLIVVVLIFGGVQLLSIGVLAEYVGRIYEEVKRRPRYVIESQHGIGSSDP